MTAMVALLDVWAEGWGAVVLAASSNRGHSTSCCWGLRLARRSSAKGVGDARRSRSSAWPRLTTRGSRRRSARTSQSWWVDSASTAKGSVQFVRRSGNIASGILASVRRGFVHGHPILAGASCVTRFAVDSS